MRTATNQSVDRPMVQSLPRLLPVRQFRMHWKQLPGIDGNHKNPKLAYAVSSQIPHSITKSAASWLWSLRFMPPKAL